MILSLISNKIEEIRPAVRLGVDRIMIDLEFETKVKRQLNKGLHLTSHSIDDVDRVAEIVNPNNMVVRINSININSKTEIERILLNDIGYIMLPYFKELSEVEMFIEYLDNRSRPILLFENIESLLRLETFLDRFQIDEVFIGLNDLSLSLGHDSIFKILAEDVFSRSVAILNEREINWGVGGVGNLLDSTLPVNPMAFLKHQLALGSTRGFLSRSFRSIFNSSNRLELLEENLNLIRLVSKEVKLVTPQEKSFLQVDFTRGFNIQN